MTRCSIRIVGLALALVLLIAPPSPGVIIFPDPGRITTEPTGGLAGSGWQYEGSWGPFLGTAIAPEYFLTARHVAAIPGLATTPFRFQGRDYVVDRVVLSPDSDLAVVHIDPAGGPLPTFAPLYTRGDEVGQHLVLFGMGPPRDGAVVVDGELRGWTWMGLDGRRSFGENDYSGVVDRGPGLGQQLTFTFDANADRTAGARPFEGAISGFDSGGGQFILDPGDGLWKLAGVNVDLDGQFKLTPDGTPFDATLFDARGLYRRDKQTGEFVLVPDGGADVPTTSYGTRVSANLGFINSVIGVPEPGSLALLGFGLAGVLGIARRRRRIASGA